MRLHTRTSDDAHRLAFVKRHLHELLRVASSHTNAVLTKPADLAAAACGASLSFASSSTNALHAVGETATEVRFWCFFGAGVAVTACCFRRQRAGEGGGEFSRFMRCTHDTLICACPMRHTHYAIN